MIIPRLTFYFAWWDVWIGAYWDRRYKTLYVQIVPMIGIRLDFRDPDDLAY